jgi:hypothetical protein
MNPAASQLFRQQAYINGQWLDAPDGACQDIFNPATSELIGRGPNLGAAEPRRRARPSGHRRRQQGLAGLACADR